MKLEKLSEPKLITQPGHLEKMIAHLEGEKIVAVDTESNSLFAYFERVCLIQFSTADTDYLVDPLALSDLSSLGPLFANPNIEKVFHAAEYDIICLKRDFGFSFANLFDTMVAASIAGMEQVGLGSLLENHFHVHLDKRFQRANWGQRPLPHNLLAYARLDTHYLIALRDLMKAALESAERWPMAEEDFRRLCQLGENNGENSHRTNHKYPDEGCWRVSGSYDLPGRKAAVLHELCRYRDQIARSLNRPLFKVFNDATLLALANHTPSTLDELKRLPGMSPRQIQRHGQALLQAIKRGLEMPPITPPKSKRPDEAYISRMEILRFWRKEKARLLGVKSDVVMPRDILTSLADRNPRTKTELGEVLSDLPWRLENFGDEILEALNNSRHN
jgi:ribonuclease D